MKRFKWLVLMAFVFPAFSVVDLNKKLIFTHLHENSNSKGLKPKKNSAFKPGEILTYRLHYGIMDAGIAVLEVKPEVKVSGGRKVYHMVGNGYSKGTFDWFFKVRDRYETFMDSSALVPWTFIRRVDEGGYKFSQDYYFNRYNNSVNVGNNQSLPIKDETQDMISSFYAARNIDFTNAKPGDVFTIDSFVDKEHWPMNIRYVGKETIKCDIGKVRCLVFRPIVQKGRIFKKEEDLKVWISDDPNHIPIRAEAKILIGSIKLDIVSAVNTLSPIAKQ
ncbi:MAG: DUF3108 domain-containing protein [Bacteroidota bacterium]